MDHQRHYPPGFLFRPTDQVLILNYLIRAQSDWAMPKVGGDSSKKIHGIRSWYARSPSYLSDRFSAIDGRFYFLTRKHPEGVRRADGGVWIAEDAKSITTEQGQIGRKVIFRFYREAGNIPEPWIMEQFCVSTELLKRHGQGPELVMCTMFKISEENDELGLGIGANPLFDSCYGYLVTRPRLARSRRPNRRYLQASLPPKKRKLKPF